MKYLVLFLGLWLLLAAAFAQKPKPADYGIKSKKALEAYLEALKQDEYRDRAKAIELYRAALLLEPDFSYAHFGLGVDVYVQENYAEAIEHLERANSLQPNAFGSIGFYLGECYFYAARYAEAVPQYESYLKIARGAKNLRDLATIQLSKAKFAAEAMKHPVPFQPINVGLGINSPENETFPYLTADGQTMLFTSRCSTSTGGYQNALRGYPEDFYLSQWKDNQWQAGENLGEPINTELNEGAPCLSQDGRTIIFTGCNYPEGLGSCDLYISYRDGNKWTKPENMGYNLNSGSWDGHPSLSHDGKQLFFSSSRQGGKGGMDIWVSEKLGDRWQLPVPLGASINSSGNEEVPFIHADGKTLYFSSTGLPGFGGRDLFVSHLDSTGSWSAAQNMGYPLNSPADEGSVFVTTKGDKGYIISDRPGGYGKTDIYSFDVPKTLRPTVATFLRGTTRDSITHTPISARVRLIELASGDTIRELFSSRSEGKFLMSLPLNRSYAAFVEAPGYLFSSKNFYLKDLSEDATEDAYVDISIDLKPVKKGVSVVLRNIFFESGSYVLQEESKVELRFLVDYMRQNPRMKIEIQGHTDNVGSDTANESLSQNRAAAVREYIVSQGVAGERIRAVGYGESQPVATNDTVEGRAQNRRTAFVILEL